MRLYITRGGGLSPPEMQLNYDPHHLQPEPGGGDVQQHKVASLLPEQNNIQVMLWSQDIVIASLYFGWIHL